MMSMYPNPETLVNFNERDALEKWQSCQYNPVALGRRERRIKNRDILPCVEKKKTLLKKSLKKTIIVSRVDMKKSVSTKSCNCSDDVKGLLIKTLDALQLEKEENRKIILQQMETISSLSSMFISAVENSPLMETIKKQHISYVGELIKGKLRNSNAQGLEESVSIRIKNNCEMFVKIFEINSTECRECMVLSCENYSCMKCEILSPRVQYLPKGGTSFYVLKTMERLQETLKSNNWMKTFPGGGCAFMVTPCFYEMAGQAPRRGVIMAKSESLYTVWFPLELKEKKESDNSGQHVLPLAGIPLRGCVKQLSEAEFKVERSVVLQHNPNGSSRFLFKFMVVDRDGYVVAGVCNYSIFSSIPKDIY